MDPMVSARVPAGLRNQVNEGLQRIGSTPTELINRAYEYFVATGDLPGKSEPIKPGMRRLDASQSRELRQSILETTFPVPESFFANKSYDELLADEMRRGYEALP